MAPNTTVVEAAKGGGKVSTNTGSLKQGSLFSFFSKKPKSTSTTTKNPSSATTTTTTATKPVTSKTTATSTVEISQHSESSTNKRPSFSSSAASVPPGPSYSGNNNNNDDSDIPVVGSRIQVYWDNDQEWYTAVVINTRSRSRNNKRRMMQVQYELDGQTEWIDSTEHRYRMSAKQAASNAKTTHASKKRRIADDDDDEDEDLTAALPSDNDDEDEESAYEQDDHSNHDDDDDEEEKWMVSEEDDEEEEQSEKLRNKKKNRNSFQNLAAITVTAYPPPISSISNKTPGSKVTPKQITPGSAATAASKPTPRILHKLPITPHSIATSSSSSSSQPPPFEEGAVNPAGSHVHNHLRFLQYPKDLQGRSPNDPNYDPRTLFVEPNEWQRITGKKMTDAVQQWWDLKAQYFDTVLLFKTGKFYELFHMDADIGVRVCGLKYMKGAVAHAGAPEISYGDLAEKLVHAGYKVARVEQTETPEQLKVRQQQHNNLKKKNTTPKPKVVNREVCSILTLGTRTFCYLDNDEKALQEPDATTSLDSCVGPLLAIREVLLESNVPPADDDNTDDEEVTPVCEYGITLIDAVRGTVTIGQFADDVLRSRMVTLLATFAPSEILLEGGGGASPTLQSLIRSFQTTQQQNCLVEIIQPIESFPKSTAIDVNIRQQMDRGSANGRINTVHPWDVEETIAELHRRKYYPAASKHRNADPFSISRWPSVLRAAVEGRAELALSSLGATLYYLQRNLIDAEILSMGIVKAYIPPESCAASVRTVHEIQRLAAHQSMQESGILVDDSYNDQRTSTSHDSMEIDPPLTPESSHHPEAEITYMSLDGTTLHNLEILTNSVDQKTAGSLWSKINFTKTPHGSRLLRAWLLRPLFRKSDIDRRADAVEELVSGAAAVAMNEARTILAKCGDMERLLSRIHSMSGPTGLDNHDEDNNNAVRIHPNDRAVLYETATYTKRKVGDFSRILNGLRNATQIPDVFQGIEIESGLLRKILRRTDQGGCFPEMEEELDFFFSNFDCDKAAKGLFEPSRGIDDLYDGACDTVDRIIQELHDFKDEMCELLKPKSTARSSWKYANTMPESKDKYLIELPASVAVPNDFIMKGKRGSGNKQINKYRTPVVEQLVQELERAYEIQKERKARGLELIFAKFDSKRALWAAAAQATALLDALGSLAQTAAKCGYTRPRIIDCPPDQHPFIKVVQGRHPCVEKTFSSSEFIPNDLTLGCTMDNGDCPRILLLSGPNMGVSFAFLRTVLQTFLQ